MFKDVHLFFSVLSLWDYSSLPHSIPAEWSEQAALWTAWPSHPDLWEDWLEPARAEVGALVAAIAAGQKVKVLAMGDEACRSADDMVGRIAEVIPARFGDIWLRDTGPIFTYSGAALRFKTNGWGGKYVLPFDDRVGDEIADLADAEVIRHEFVLEGGAVEHNGAGAILTTRQCLLNPNRNVGWSEPDAERALASAFGASKIYWLDAGLKNDHTDGHIDNVARFVSADKVVCQSSFGADDPNIELFESVADTLRAAGLDVMQIPSPGGVRDEAGDITPASHMNFVIANNIVVVPTYGTDSAEEAVDLLADLFDDRQVIGLPSNALLSGGGSFHCITQQEPQTEAVSL